MNKIHQFRVDFRTAEHLYGMKYLASLYKLPVNIFVFKCIAQDLPDISTFDENTQMKIQAELEKQRAVVHPQAGGIPTYIHGDSNG